MSGVEPTEVDRAAIAKAQAERRVALIERIGTIAELSCEKPLEGELGDIAYDLLRQAAAQMSSDRLHIERLSIPAVEDELTAGKSELRRLMESIWRAEYAKDAPDWKPLDDLPGMISQIDNMYAGVRNQRDEARARSLNPTAPDLDGCPSCHGMNTSCPDGCGRNAAGELDGSTLLPTAPDRAGLPRDVRRLVIAARNIAYVDIGHHTAEELRELDQAAEAFSDRVHWLDEPSDDPDGGMGR